MPRTITVQKDHVTMAEDGSATVTLPDTVVTAEELTQNFIPRSDHDAHVAGVEERLASVQRKAQEGERDRLLKDDTFLDHAVKSRSDFFQKRFPESPDPSKFLEQFRAEELAPVVEEKEKLSKRVEKLITRSETDAIQVAMGDAKVKVDQKPFIEAYMQRLSRYSEEHGKVVVMGEDGKPMTRLVEGQVRPITPTEHLLSLRASGKYDGSFEADAKGGAGFRGPDDVTPENLDAAIQALEREGKFEEAQVLKAKKLRLKGTV